MQKILKVLVVVSGIVLVASIIAMFALLTMAFSKMIVSSHAAEMAITATFAMLISTAVFIPSVVLLIETGLHSCCNTCDSNGATRV